MVSYFKDGGAFTPTDIEYLRGMFYVTTGYSPLDYVLTARIMSTAPFSAEWDRLAFGGKGDQPGQFGTGHGITIGPDGQELYIADRPNAEIDRFDPRGHYLSTLELPEGAFPCDVDFEDEYAVVGCLHGPDRSKGAPIYILCEGEVISTVMPKEDLKLDRFQHIHNAVMRQIGGTFYLIVQSWNPGDFAILEQAR